MDKKEIIKKIREYKENQKKEKKRGFKQSADISVNFENINIESPDSKLNLNILLPKGRGMDVKIGVFAEGDMRLNAKKLSKYVLDKKEIGDHAKNKRKMRKIANSCYAFIAQVDFMPLVGKSWGIVLGPRGKMPQPVPGNADLNPVFTRLKNTIRIKSKKNPTVNVPVGTEDMGAEDLADNILAVMDGIDGVIAEENLKSVYFKVTMGPSIKLL